MGRLVGTSLAAGSRWWVRLTLVGLLPLSLHAENNTENENVVADKLLAGDTRCGVMRYRRTVPQPTLPCVIALTR